MQCWNGELPDLAMAHNFQAIFITGSHYSAYEEHDWIGNLITWLHEFLLQDSTTKIVAVCFGSQVCSCCRSGTAFPALCQQGHAALFLCFDRASTID
jgi:GMP synthase-like glutamine amidotransferase